MSTSFSHFKCNIETARGEIKPSKGPKPGQHDYPLLNRVGENISKRFGVTFLDITSALQSRSDGHMPHDCGHWCLPGPYDLGAQLLYNAFVGHIDAPVSSLPQDPMRHGTGGGGGRSWSRSKAFGGKSVG